MNCATVEGKPASKTDNKYFQTQKIKEREKKKKEFGEISFRSYKKTCQIVLNLFETGSLYYMLVQGFRVYWFIHWSIQ